MKNKTNTSTFLRGGWRVNEQRRYHQDIEEVGRARYLCKRSVQNIERGIGNVKRIVVAQPACFGRDYLGFNRVEPERKLDICFNRKLFKQFCVYRLEQYLFGRNKRNIHRESALQIIATPERGCAA